MLNRGRKLIPGWAQDVDGAAAIRLERPEDAGNGFLLDAGLHPRLGGLAARHARRPEPPRMQVPAVPA